MAILYGLASHGAKIDAPRTRWPYLEQVAEKAEDLIYTLKQYREGYRDPWLPGR